MPSPKSPQPASPATIQEVPAPEVKKRPANPMTLLRKVRENTKETLKVRFEEFIDQATAEEQRFMLNVMNDWEGMFATPRGLSQHEVPLFSAIQMQINDMNCVAVPGSDLVPAVEEFITALALKSDGGPKASYGPETKEQIEDRLGRRFRAEVELFHRDAGRPSLKFMLDILARWNELHADQALAAVPNQLAVAVEIELNKYKAKVAAEDKAA